MNENPEGLPKEFVKQVLSEITPEFLAIYPEPDRFARKYAAFIGVDAENILTANGSDMAIRYILETFGEKGRSVVTVSPSFEMYRVNCSILGLTHVPVEYEPDLSIDVRKILSAIDDSTRIVVLLNPNNPVGNVYTEEEAGQVIRRARDVGAAVIIDEAYYLFHPVSFLQLALKYGNVLLIRTFSKLFSLAACRLGVVIGSRQIIDYLRKIRLSFDVNAIALLFGERILERPDIIQDLIDSAEEGKQFTLEQLSAGGYTCKKCAGNYILVKPKHDAHAIAKRLEDESKVLVHTFGNPLMSDLLRISTGSKDAMRIFLDAFFRADA